MLGRAGAELVVVVRMVVRTVAMIDSGDERHRRDLGVVSVCSLQLFHQLRRHRSYLGRVDRHLAAFLTLFLAPQRPPRRPRSQSWLRGQPAPRPTPYRKHRPNLAALSISVQRAPRARGEECALASWRDNYCRLARAIRL